MTILNEPFVLFKTPETDPERLKELQREYLAPFCELIAYEAEENGAMFQHIIPSPEMKYTQSSSGSGVELEIHTEQAFSKLRPDILSLACVRGNPSAITYILPLKSIIDNVTSEEYQLLHQPLWMCGVDLSFRVGGFDFVEGETRGPMSIISEKENLVYDYDLMSGLTPGATELHLKIKRIYEEHRIGINLETGDILVLNNNKVLHGRSPFTPTYDSNDRFLLRCFGTFDLKKSEYARNGDRVILARFS
jgi:hypothetical protein